MCRSIVRNLSGLVSRRGAVVAAALAAGAIATPAQAAAIRICAMGNGWGIWVEVIWATETFGNYDPVTHAGVIDFNAMSSQNPDDVVFPYASTSGDLVVLHGPATMAMGSFEVASGLGTGQCEFSWPNIWITGSNWGIHFINNPGTFLGATMQLTGFTADGEGIYEAHGLSIPLDFEVTGPDGVTQIVTKECTSLEFRSPLDLSPPCPADMDGNGVLNLDDVNYFVQNFIAGCP